MIGHCSKICNCNARANLNSLHAKTGKAHIYGLFRARSGSGMGEIGSMVNEIVSGLFEMVRRRSVERTNPVNAYVP